MEQVAKEPTVMKKRVFKKVITPNGEEILLTPSPTLSRQSSTDISDLSEEDKKGKKVKYNSKKKSERVYVRQKSQTPTEGRTDFIKRATLEEDMRPEPSGTGGCSIKLSITSFEDDEDGTKVSRAASVQELHRALSREKSRSSKELLVEEEGEEEEEEEEDTHYREEEQTKPEPAVATGAKIASDNKQVVEREASSKKESTVFLQGPARFPHLSSTSPHRPHRPHHSTSPSSSDEASAANQSETIDQESSPRLRDLSPDLHDSSPQFFGRAHDHAQARANENRRRFEKSLALRDQDADDSVETYSQLVSALTELRPPSVTPRKLVGRSYSDGETFGSVRERHFIRLRRLDGQGGDCFWTSPSTERDTSGLQSSSTSRNGVKTKVIQSDSLRKACMYIQDRTLTHSLSLSSTSPDHVPLEDTPEQALDTTTSGGTDPAEAADADAASVSQRRQKMSSLKQQWKTFDPDVSRTSEQEITRDGGQGQAKKLKKSLSYSDSGSGAHGFDTIQYNLAESLRLETMSIMDKLSEDDEILEVVIESPGQPEVERDIQEELSPRKCKDWDMGSDGSSSSTSVKNSFLGSTEMYNSNVKLPSKSGRKDIRRRITEKNTISPENEPDSKVFRTIDKLKHKSREFLPTPVSIIIPKAKASKSTQASYEEIKAETGWVRPAVRVHKRKKYISVTDSHGKQSSFDDAFHNGSNLPKEPSSTDSAEETGRRCTDRSSRMPPRSDPPASDQDFRTWRDENQGQSISRWIQQNERAEQMSVDEEHVKGHFDVGTSPWWGQQLQRDRSGGAVITLGQGYGYIQGRKRREQYPWTRFYRGGSVQL
ncbi:hypothetical protein C0Q70_03309 [Pomacea canaliculata]|uniref:Uncharacterized protein n=1 Tax=Pomacea canaliculata TaxID=400727 RepID=A0A2T7PSG1_POMCA|nr:uncharacterized protein LOC112556991 [Pomacea canaliculata]PVD36330.1 hypothetical protein C0Q70_03309 [Pomacea canaliculata]